MNRKKTIPNVECTCVDIHQMKNNPCGFVRRDKLNFNLVTTSIATFLQRRNLGDLGFKKKKSCQKNLGVLMSPTILGDSDKDEILMKNLP